MGKKLHARTRPPAQHATKRPASVATSDDDEEKQERERDGRARAIIIMERHGAQSRWLCCPGPGISADGPKAREGGEENEPLCGAAALRWGRAGPSLSSPLLHGLAAVTLAACGSSLSPGPDTAFTPLDRPLPTPCPPLLLFFFYHPWTTVKKG